MAGSSVKRIAAILALCAATACGKSKQEQPKGRPPLPVTTASVGKQTIPVQLEAIGSVESLTSVAVKSMVNGEITKVHFTDGQEVRKGQTLFTIDTRPSVAALKKAEADLASIRVQLANAQADADRYGKLVKDGIVTPEQYESYRTKADSLAAALAAQQASIENLKVQVSYCTIRSPITGKTGNVLINVGNVVKANDTPSLVTINQITPIAVTFTIPERELARVRPQFAAGRLIAEATPSGDNGPPEKGKVDFLDNAVDQATGTIKLRATFANGSRRLWPGQFASVRLTLATLADATVAPSQAVQTGQQGQYVFVVKSDGTADLRPIKAGVTYNGMTVIEQGVRPGEQVVTDGQMRLLPGARVEVRKPQPKQGTAADVRPGSGPSSSPASTPQNRSAQPGTVAPVPGSTKQ